MIEFISGFVVGVVAIILLIRYLVLDEFEKYKE